MPIYCTATDKIAIVTLTKNGQQFQVKSSNPPLTIVCKDNNYPDCTKVSVLTKVVTQGFGGTATNQYTYRLNAPVLGLRIINNNDELQFYCRGTSDGTCQAPRWFTVADLLGVSGSFYSASIISITPINPVNPNNNMGKGIQITDKNNSIIYDDNTIDCNWSVQCDENCPSGHMKCKCSQFPGYCCVSCSEIKSGIREVKAKIRSLSDG